MSMPQELDEQISKLRKSEWVDLHGLVTCATLHFSITESAGPHCVSISLLGQGSYNTVYKLAFSNGTEVAASISRCNESRFNPEAKRSEISTMSFVRESGLYPDVPVPKVLASELTFTNPACAPYVLMEVVPGVTADLGDEESDDTDATAQARDLTLVKALAKLQASLFRPVPFHEIGSLVTDTNGKYVVGPLMTMNQGTLDGPFKSIQDFWRFHLKDEMSFALREWVDIETDDFPRKESSLFQPPCTPQKFVELFQLLSSLVPHFQPPKSCLSLVLYHPDIALRNTLFEESSISSDNPKITGVIDWGGAQILPVMLTAHYPGDLMTERHSPFTHPENPKEMWLTVPCDWTSTGDVSKWPQGVWGATNKPIDFTSRVRTTIRKFYLRAYFSACYAEQLHDLHGVADLACATMFKDAPYYLKFHELICGGWHSWVEHETWIRETYWRLRAAGHGTRGSEELVVGPNVYRESMEGVLCDLGIPGEYPIPIARM